MKKVTVSLPQGDWGTLKTKYPKDSDKVKFNEFTGTSKNFDTDISGVITKAPGNVLYNPNLMSAPASDSYEAIFSSGTHHLLTVTAGTLNYSSGGGSFNTVTAGYSATGNFEFALYQDRVYFGNGVDNPQTYDLTTSYGGVSYSAPRTKQMGCAVPTAPSAALRVDNTASQVPAGAHTYKVTYLYYGAEESNGSPASSAVTNDATHTSTTVTIPVGAYGVTARKIYRDNADGNWTLLATVSDNTTTSYVDLLPSTIGTLLPTDNGVPPVFSKVLQHRDRLWVAGVSSSTSTLFYSSAGQPDIFNATGYILCNPKDPIVGLAAYNNKVMVFNRNSLGYISGSTSSDFAYVQIPSPIGCVDNRSIQVRTVNGVPVIVWLSDKGIYQFNGSSITYISDDIEDQVNFNIQQASQVKGKNSQDTQADFLAGTATPGISLTAGGLVTQANPKVEYQLEADYLTGTLTNMAMHGIGNTMRCVTANTFGILAGTANSVVTSSSSISLPSNTANLFENHFLDSETDVSNTSNGTIPTLAQPITLAHASTITRLKFNPQCSGDITVKILVWADNGGVPGTAVYTSSPFSNVLGLDLTGLSISLSSGNYWIGYQYHIGAGGGSFATRGTSTAWTLAGGRQAKEFDVNSTWSTLNFHGTPLPGLAGNVEYSYGYFTPAGSWTSATYDTLSDTAAPIGFTQTGSYPTGTSSTSYLEGSNDQTTWDVSIATVTSNGTTVISTSNRRYWRVRCNLTTTADLATPSVGIPSITFPTTATWTSPVIDSTSDITAINALTYVVTAATGSTTSLQIATSTDNITYSSYVAVGSATPARYSKLKVTINSSGDNLLSASVNDIFFIWTVVSTFTSSAIDTGATPVGWELFQTVVGSLGTATFQVRTATTSGGLSGASWVNASNGTYITATVARWIQWKVVLTATNNTVPFVDSVTINWFISQVGSIRVTSLFYNRSYFISAAEFGQTINNIVFKLDEFNRWRVYRELNIGTMTYFFNQPYFTSAKYAQVLKWLTGNVNSDNNIIMDVQTAAINYGDLEHNKILRKVRVIGKNTGATYTPQYSTDNGLTWKSMINVKTGLSTFTTTSDGGLFDIRVQPIFSADNATGLTHVFRLTNSDIYGCEIHAIKLEAWVRQGDI